MSHDGPSLVLDRLFSMVTCCIDTRIMSSTAKIAVLSRLLRLSRSVTPSGGAVGGYSTIVEILAVKGRA